MADATPRYPDVEVELTGTDGNAYAIMAAVSRGLRNAGVSDTERDAFTAEATSGNDDHLIQTAMRWVTVL
jgi:ribosomal protein S9